MTKDEALTLALEALTYCEALNRPVHEQKMHAITAIKKALAQPEQEPVARVIDDGSPEGATEWIPFAKRVEPLKTGDLLYTAPPKRPWVGLTDEELLDIADMAYANDLELLHNLQAKLKEKNT